MNLKSKSSVITICVTVSIVAVVTIYFLSKKKALNPEKLDGMTKVTYVASKKFKELPDSEKSKYLSKAKISRNNINQLSQEQKKAFFINSLKFQNALIKKRMKKFYGMSHSEQERFLKAEAARIKKIRAMAKHNKQHKKKPVPSPEDIKLRMQCYLETIDAQTRAQMEEYRKRLKEKLES